MLTSIGKGNLLKALKKGFKDAAWHQY